jgi:CspA family cold shock protein
MVSVGVVRAYDWDLGWGVVDGADVPGGCWVHLSAIAADGYRTLDAGQQVSFRAEAVPQDGYDFRAVKVWTGATEPADPVQEQDDSGAYQSTLTITYDE